MSPGTVERVVACVLPHRDDTALARCAVPGLTVAGTGWWLVVAWCDRRGPTGVLYHDPAVASAHVERWRQAGCGNLRCRGDHEVVHLAEPEYGVAGVSRRPGPDATCPRCGEPLDSTPITSWCANHHHPAGSAR